MPSLYTIKNKSGGFLPVVILGTDNLNVSDVNVESIQLEGVAVTRSSIRDLGSSVGMDPKVECGNCSGKGKDGFDDLLIRFDKRDVVAALGGVTDGEEITLTLTGELADGTPIRGTDCVIIDVKDKGLAKHSAIPEGFSLAQNYPNTFNPTTAIQYAIAEPSHVTLTVYDLLGRQVVALVNEFQEAGYKIVTWDSNDRFGDPVSGGIYLYQIRAGSFVETRKMVLLR